ncbi:hypothetical protein HBB16_02570 [Pseudonocardia sp. MCCB 268]|nr:hypothetical protein [Pseudonocardia cytotoxica]
MTDRPSGAIRWLARWTPFRSRLGCAGSRRRWRGGGVRCRWWTCSRRPPCCAPGCLATVTLAGRTGISLRSCRAAGAGDLRPARTPGYAPWLPGATRTARRICVTVRRRYLNPTRRGDRGRDR